MPYAHLGPYSDLVNAARRGQRLWPMAKPSAATRRRLEEVLAFEPGPVRPRSVRIERRWKRDGLAGEVVSWSVGYGPRLQAWVLKPADATGPLPGIVALHDHGAFKYYGKEKIADGPDRTPRILRDWRQRCYGGRAFANALAREGYVVLVPDVFMWGSRRMPMQTLCETFGGRSRQFDDAAAKAPTARQIDFYNNLAAQQEHLLEKYCHALGTTLAGIVSHEDRVAVDYLAGRKDVSPGRIGCVGLSGGGLRSALLQATCERISAAVIVGLMFTYEGVLDHNVIQHTWLCFPADWARYGDWSDLAACRAPSPLMVQYDLEDELFTEPAMRAAHRRIRSHYRSVGKPANYVGRFYPGPHKFDLPMQADAFAWLRRQLVD